MRLQMQIALILATGTILSGCGSLFDELDRAAEIQAEWNAQNQGQQASGTDYVQACNTYGCPSTPATGQTTTNTRPSGCPYAAPGSAPTSGTACPQ